MTSLPVVTSTGRSMTSLVVTPSGRSMTALLVLTSSGRSMTSLLVVTSSGRLAKVTRGAGGVVSPSACPDVGVGRGGNSTHRLDLSDAKREQSKSSGQNF
eukprot:GHVT01104288.1.p2 GENE.GHVT01104288.1~~GHVT01104288.1.p2  ORF type:complete len:100 (-),score=1.90 GHVT01104288.1:812-1111(-)